MVVLDSVMGAAVHVNAQSGSIDCNFGQIGGVSGGKQCNVFGCESERLSSVRRVHAVEGRSQGGGLVGDAKCRGLCGTGVEDVLKLSRNVGCRLTCFVLCLWGVR